MSKPFIGAILLFSLESWAGTVVGTLPAEWLTRSSRPGDIHYWRLKMLSGARPTGSPALVLLFSPRQRNETPPVEIQVSGFSFQPPLVAVGRGQRLIIRNESGRPLSCRASGTDSLFFENLLPGSRFEATLDQEGVSVLLCQNQPFMRLAVVVGAVAYSALADHEGRFQLNAVAGGDYTLKVLVGEKWMVQREIKVGAVPLRLDLGQPEADTSSVAPAKEPPPASVEVPAPPKPAEKLPEAKTSPKPPEPPASTEEKHPPKRPPKPAETEKMEPKPPAEDQAIKNVEPEIEVEEE